ncbi:MAG: thioredoxin family protein [Saprospiraceae bacterium]|nr:thioredoxin family protein [Saprospiraceae bacterium]
MSLTESNMMELGTLAPSFQLTDVVSGESISTEDLRSDLGTIVMFWCNHCPYVIHVTDTVIEIAEKYMMKGFNFVAISSNDIEKYPQDGPEKMRALAQEKDYPFPYLFDSTQNVAKDFDAACTPDFYVFDRNLELVYRGQLDDSRPGNNKPLTGADLVGALDAIIMKKPVSLQQRPSAGCNIKWK